MYCQFCTKEIELDLTDYSFIPTHPSEIGTYKCSCGMFVYDGAIFYKHNDYEIRFYWDHYDADVVYIMTFFDQENVIKLPFLYPDFKEKISILPLIDKVVLNKDLY